MSRNIVSGYKRTVFRNGTYAKRKKPIIPKISVIKVILITSLILRSNCKATTRSPKRINNNTGKMDKSLTVINPYVPLTTSAIKTNKATTKIDKAILGNCIIRTLFRSILATVEAKIIAPKRTMPATMPIVKNVIEKETVTNIPKLGRPITCRTKATMVANKGKRRIRTIVLAGTPIFTAYCTIYAQKLRIVGLFAGLLEKSDLTLCCSKGLSGRVTSPFCNAGWACVTLGVATCVIEGVSEGVTSISAAKTYLAGARAKTNRKTIMPKMKDFLCIWSSHRNKLSLECQ